MTRDEARALNRLLNPTAVGTNSTLKQLYVDDVERGTIAWDQTIMSGGHTYGEATLNVLRLHEAHLL